MSTNKQFSNSRQSFPATGFFDITPADEDIDPIPRAIYIGGAGDLTVVDAGGNEVTFTGLLANTVLPIQPVQVKSTGTTATNLIGLK